MQLIKTISGQASITDIKAHKNGGGNFVFSKMYHPDTSFASMFPNKQLESHESNSVVFKS